MSSVSKHYEGLLAPIYSWMVGGTDAAFATGASDLASIVADSGFAIDLGAGFGMHTIPLARAGWRVLSIDSSSTLLAELAKAAAGLPVTTHCGDLLHFSELSSPDEIANLILCMGDTLTHLETTDQVAQLARSVAGRLAPNGRFVATFRNYSRLPTGTARFIPVRADDQRILTCFLEEFDSYVEVHDIVHERAGSMWKTSVSSYRKLRLLPEWVRHAFQSAGLRATLDQGPRGMVRLLADA